MNILQNIKPWFMTDGSDERKNFKKSRYKGKYSYKSDKTSASLTVAAADEDGLNAVYVKSSLKGAKFSTDRAVALEIPSLGDIEGYMADFLYSPFWCRPQFGDELSKVPVGTQALLWKNKSGSYGFILPVVDEIYKATLFGTEGGVSLGLTSFMNTYSTCETLACVYGEGDEPYKLMNDCAHYAMKLLNNGASVRTDRRYPELFEYLGWCSWDAMEIRVNTAGLLEKCEEFKQKEIPVKWAIIDDMWADTDNLRDIPDDLTRATGMFKVMHASKLNSFEADAKRFPEGLGGCISQMKQKYGMKVGMWHPTTGYWSGMTSDGPLAKQFRNELITVPNGRLMPRLELEKAYAFYNAFHTFLQACGADFVKIDNQSTIDMNYKNVYPVGQAARALQRAIDSSVGANFDNAIINCMGMANENMFNRPEGAISRCSNDFQPENRAWFINHILQCSYNSLVQGMFYWCDWDMWWTDDAQAVKNSVVRAVSGGPIYVSDKIGRSRPEIFKPLCYSDGRILRCEAPAVPTKDCLVCDPETSGKLFKVYNTYENGGVIAAFNLDKEEKPVSGTVSAADFDAEYDEYALYEHFSGEVKILRKGEVLDITLANHDDFRLYTAVPAVSGFAVLGLIDKFNSPLSVKAEFAGVYSIYEGGEFAFVSAEDKDFTLTTESGVYKPARNGILYTASLPLGDRHIKLED